MFHVKHYCKGKKERENKKMLYKVLMSNTIGKMVYSGSMFDPEHDKILASYGVKFHHSATERGYISRKENYCELYEYHGKFGEGIVEFSALYNSSVYCYKAYYIKEDET